MFEAVKRQQKFADLFPKRAKVLYTETGEYIKTFGRIPKWQINNRWMTPPEAEAYENHVTHEHILTYCIPGPWIYSTWDVDGFPISGSCYDLCRTCGDFRSHHICDDYYGEICDGYHSVMRVNEPTGRTFSVDPIYVRKG